MEIRDSEMSLVFFILYICKMKKIMKEKNQVCLLYTSDAADD